jgi:hypothetical protein
MTKAKDNLKQKCGAGYPNPPHLAPQQLLQWPGRRWVIQRVVVYGHGLAPVTAGTVSVVGEVEPHIGRIRGVGGDETRSCRVASVAVL